MEFIDKMKIKAKENIKTICLPESEDIRILKGAEIALQENYAKIVLIGDESIIKNTAIQNNINIEKATIINPLNFQNTEKYIDALYELRKEKGLTLEEAKELIMDSSRYYATMMLKMGDVDGIVSGACHPTSDTLKPALQIIKGKNGIKTVSAFFVMCLPDKTFGDEGLFIYADSGMNSNPNEDELSDIAISSANSYKELISSNKDPKVAMLSYSTYGSAHSELTEKVSNATKLANQKAPDILIEGELQLDAAVIPEIAKSKAPNSKIEGRANVLIFPDLNSGNIAYKLTERFAKAKAYGPLCQGLQKPVNDLSRGCSAEDVAGVIAITCVQAQINI